MNSAQAAVLLEALNRIAAALEQLADLASGGEYGYHGISVRKAD
jgi:hypothetical protein